MPSGHSVTEFVKYRYGSLGHSFVAIISIFYMLVFLCAELTGISSAANLIGGIPNWITALIIGLCASTYVGLYTECWKIQLKLFILIDL